MSEVDTTLDEAEPDVAGEPDGARRIYTYGCRRPDPGNHRLLLGIMRAAHNYRNKLVEIELWRRSELAKAALETDPEWLRAKATLDEIDAEVERLSAARKRLRKETRSRQKPDDGLEALLERRKAARQQEKFVRKAAYARAKPKLAGVEREALERQKQARAASGLAWGTYGLVEQAMGNIRTGPPPVFRRWDGVGRVGVLIAYGIGAERLHSCEDTRLQLRQQSVLETPGKLKPQAKNIGRYKMGRIRVGSDNRSPVWAELPVIWHRELPEGALIKTAWVRRFMTGDQEQWRLSLVLDVPRESLPGVGSGVAAIDLNYRVQPSGSQRVATLFDDSGRVERLTIDAGTVGQRQQVDNLQSIRDQRMNDTRAVLAAWLEGHADQVPADIVERLKHLAEWRSCRRFRDLCDELQHREIDAEGWEGLVVQLREHRAKEDHLHDYQSGLRQQLLDWRREMYRKWVHDLRLRYGTIVLERMDLRHAVHDTRRDKELQEVEPAQRWRASFVGLSELRGILVASGMRIIEAPSNNSTSDCHACGQRCEFDQARRVRWTCEHCGVEWDQDENAARNLLRRAANLIVAPPKEKKPSRSARFKAARARRTAEREHKARELVERLRPLDKQARQAELDKLEERALRELVKKLLKESDRGKEQC